MNSNLACILAGFLLFCGPAKGLEEVTVSLGSDALAEARAELGVLPHYISKSSGFGLIRLPGSELPRLSALMHDRFGRCGGFMLEPDPLKALLDWQLSEKLSGYSGSKSIRHEDTVRRLIDEVREENIRGTIEILSSFRNRYYRSAYGSSSQERIRQMWQSLASGLGDRVSVEFFRHSDYPQPSVILTWRGGALPSEEVILGGHGDSIAGWFPGNNVLAPGADDNASGIATMTEALRVLAEGGFDPDRTIRLMSYAAEEVGLRGSAEIANSFAQEGVNVTGVMQLDMTNFAASSFDMVLMTDYTNAAQNRFVGTLIDTYLPDIRWKEDRCGYACSDHASWNREGFPVSFPFEAPMNEHNNQIHTAGDTLEQSDHHAEHATPFAKLAVAFLVEMSSR